MTMTEEQRIREAYARAQERYAGLGVDTEAAMASLETTPISLQCWQGDDVVGFEQKAGVSDGGGIQVTGGYPGRARTVTSGRFTRTVSRRYRPSSFVLVET